MQSFCLLIVEIADYILPDVAFLYVPHTPVHIYNYPFLGNWLLSTLVWHVLHNPAGVPKWVNHLTLHMMGVEY